MLAGTRSAAQRRGGREGGPARRERGAPRRGPNRGLGWGRRRIARTRLSTAAVLDTASAARRAGVGRRGQRRAGSGSGSEGCGSQGGEDAEEQGRGGVVVLVVWGSSLLPAGTRRCRSHTWPVSSQGGVRPPRLPAPSGVTDLHRPPLPTCATGPRLRPPRRGLSNMQGAEARHPRAPSARPAEGWTCAGRGVRSARRRRSQESRAPAFEDFYGPRVEIG